MCLMCMDGDDDTIVFIYIYIVIINTCDIMLLMFIYLYTSIHHAFILCSLYNINHVVFIPKTGFI